MYLINGSIFRFGASLAINVLHLTELRVQLDDRLLCQFRLSTKIVGF
jgi:hypothetical protein